MIGVIADVAEYEAVREFFELFKTPWEFYRNEEEYDVVLCSGNGLSVSNAKLVLLYASRRTRFDGEQKIQTGQPRQNRTLRYGKDQIPIYGETIGFLNAESHVLTDDDSHESAVHIDHANGTTFCRVGYDLFSEVGWLLRDGQPVANAAVPTLELHISLLRELIVGSGLSLVEIPPVPDGYNFLVCLTHDIDHPSIRQHGWDHTSLGFLYRAVFGSLRSLLRGRIGIRQLAKNWRAAATLPFVHLGMASDCWSGFADLYLQIEHGLPSTFYAIPFRGRPGKNVDSRAAKLRAARYGAADIASSIRKLLAAGCEIGLHGIDAWTDSAAGGEELDEIRRLTGVSNIGVRMHWLYYDQQSPRILEQASAAYDSSVGYNDTVGYRAGTTQAYKPLDASYILELPLHVMDTALFYPDYLDLSPQDAETVLDEMTDNALRHGGCMTINWHDRSTAPERLWGETYRHLIEDLKSSGAWFATAGQAIAWFQKRRSATFQKSAANSYALRVEFPNDDVLPGLRVRAHSAVNPLGALGRSTIRYQDMPLEGRLHTTATCSATF